MQYMIWMYKWVFNLKCCCYKLYANSNSRKNGTFDI